MLNLVRLFPAVFLVFGLFSTFANAAMTTVTFSTENPVIAGSFSYIQTNPDPSLSYSEVSLLPNYGVDVKIITNNIYYRLDRFGLPSKSIEIDELKWQCVGSEGCRVYFSGVGEYLTPKIPVQGGGFTYDRFLVSFGYIDKFVEYVEHFRITSTNGEDIVSVGLGENPNNPGLVWWNENVIYEVSHESATNVPEPAVSLLLLGLLCIYLNNQKRLL